MIKISNLHKSFGDLHVLKGIDLQVNQGDIIAIIGPSGSGKSTLLHCINKLEEPTVGHVFIDDEDMPEINWKGLTKDANFYINKKGNMRMFMN